MSVLNDVSKLPSMVTSQEEEFKIMKEARGFLATEFGGTVEIAIAEESSHPKAKSAWPGKVGIVVE